MICPAEPVYCTEMVLPGLLFSEHAVRKVVHFFKEEFLK